MRVLIVYKRSFLEAHGNGGRSLSRLDPADRARIVRSDAENRRALGDVAAHLARRGVRVDAVHRGSHRRYDLVIALGGDGTFFAAARHLHGAPLLGINSDPSHSLGLWMGSDRTNFGPTLDLALEGTLKPVRVRRIQAAINGRATRELAFNEVLVAHKNPSAMTRYRIAVGRRNEEHRSSGVWVATGAGSTAAIRSAGGRRMPVGSPSLQFLVREPYRWPRTSYAILHGFVPRLSLQALTVDLALWIDGSKVRYDLAIGDRVDLRIGPALEVLGYDETRRRRLFP
jgi:NAD+ kinase